MFWHTFHWPTNQPFIQSSKQSLNPSRNQSIKHLFKWDSSVQCEFQLLLNETGAPSAFFQMILKCSELSLASFKWNCWNVVSLQSWNVGLEFQLVHVVFLQMKTEVFKAYFVFMLLKTTDLLHSKANMKLEQLPAVLSMPGKWLGRPLTLHATTVLDLAKLCFGTLWKQVGAFWSCFFLFSSIW